MIKQCQCPSPFQDKTYGSGNRVMNEAKRGDVARCTVCSREYSISNSDKKKEEIKDEKS